MWDSPASATQRSRVACRHKPPPCSLPLDLPPQSWETHDSRALWSAPPPASRQQGERGAPPSAVSPPCILSQAAGTSARCPAELVSARDPAFWSRRALSKIPGDAHPKSHLYSACEVPGPKAISLSRYLRNAALLPPPGPTGYDSSGTCLFQSATPCLRPSSLTDHVSSHLPIHTHLSVCLSLHPSCARLSVPAGLRAH